MAVDVKRVQAVFLTAVEAENTDQRAAILDRECAGDNELRGRVEALLQAHQAPASILERPAATPIEAAPLPSDGTVALDSSINRAAPRQDPVTTADGPGGDEIASALEFLQPSTKPGSLGRLGHYEVLEILGQGGFGVVVRAFDEKLQRVVAIKVMSAQLASVSPARKRFLREARASAKVRHEHVVQIYAVEEQPIPYLVMEYIPGRTLQQKLDDTGPLEHTEMLRLAVQIAHGLAAAHAQGLIHRDIKPSNILLDEGIEPRVKITDFGLARAADDASLTQSGVVAGTPMYMAPEQAEGKTLDQRADLFSLGSVFYVMLSGRPPFRASGTMAVLKRVCEDTPRPIREIIPEVPEWLEAAIGKLHAKKPEERFQTAAEVGDLLGQHLAHWQQPHLVPQPAAVERIAVAAKEQPLKPLRPRRRWKTLVAAAVVLAVAGVGITYLMTRPNGPPPSPPFVKGTDKYFDALKRENIHPALLALAGGGDADQAPSELVAVLGEPRKFLLPDNESRAWMAQTFDGKVLAVPYGLNVALFDAESGALLRTLVGHKGRVFSVAFSPDGTRLVSGAGGDSTVRVWNTHTGEGVASFTGHTAGVWAVAFSPDGTRIVSGGENASLFVWEADTGKQLFTLPGHTALIFNVGFSPDGKRIASASFDRTVRVWEVETEKEIDCLKGHTQEARKVAFSRNGKVLATGSDGELILWDADSLKRINTLPTPAGWIAFDPDGQTLLAGSHQSWGKVHQATRWNIATGKEVATLQLQDRDSWALFHLSPDGKTLFGTRDASEVPYVRSYDAHTGKELLPRQGHVGALMSIAVSPDGKLVASSGADRTVKLWDLAAWKAGDVLPPVRTFPAEHTDIIRALVFGRNGKLLASASNDHTVVVWDVDRGEVIRSLTGTSVNLFRPAFSPDGRILAAGYDDGGVRLWDLSENKEGRLLCKHAGPVRCVAFSPDGQQVASGSQDRLVFVSDVLTGRRLQKFALPNIVNNVAYSPDGKTLAAVGDFPDGAVRVWDVATWKQEALPGHTSHVHGLEFSPIAPLMATRAADGTVRLWDRTPGSVCALSIQVGPAGGQVNACFTPEGRYLVTGNSSGAIVILKVPQPPPPYVPGPPIKLPDPLELAKRSSAADNLQRKDIPIHLFINFGMGKVEAPPELVAILEHGSKQIGAVAISLDGKLLASCGDDHNAKVWDLTNGKLLHTLGGHKLGVGPVAFCPNFGKGGPGPVLLATTDAWAQTVKLWDLNTETVIRTLTGHTAFTQFVVFSPDGRWLASADTGGTVRLWDVATGKHLRSLPNAAAEWSKLAFSPDGKLLAVPGGDGLIRLWAPATGWVVGTLTGHKQPARGVAFLPDGQTLASSSFDGTIRVWDLSTMREKKVLTGTRTYAVSLAWRADGRLLASDDAADGTLRLWDPTADPSRHQAIRLFPAPAQFLHGVAFTPEGRHVATANPDGTIYILRLADPGVVYAVPADDAQKK